MAVSEFIILWLILTDKELGSNIIMRLSIRVFGFIFNKPIISVHVPIIIRMRKLVIISGLRNWPTTHEKLVKRSFNGSVLIPN